MEDIVRVKDFTKRKGITQEELAKKLGVSNNTVTNWAKGKRFPARKTERALLEMGMTVEELFNKPYPSSVINMESELQRKANYLANALLANIDKL